VTYCVFSKMVWRIGHDFYPLWLQRWKCHYPSKIPWACNC